ncbi:cytosolic iron-sulfur protein assembly protein CIAO1 [Phytophthora nicotianae]|uniref:Cytosolic iron-sulfur protein assembly protein CIAO1 n=1 Tax=Phytophthora nicotianae TaxID=4792 RepID=A0A0W8D3A7_PHYNI|nr:cytosolic iron-sulfur protein assembly protein CIAO1 [Phytophthora nicotianae]
MLEELAPRKVPGRPRKRTKAHHSESGAPITFSVAKLVPKFLKHPGTPLKWNLLKPFVPNQSKGLEENVPGQVKSYALDGKVYVWRCEFEHGATEYLEVEELAHCIEKAALANYTIIPST